MESKVLKVLGFSVREQQFAVKTANYSFTVKDGRELVRDVNANSAELLLAKLAGSIHAVGKLVGNTLGLDLKSIQIEVSGVIKGEGFEKDSLDHFNRVDVIVKPTSEASIVLLKEWLDAVKSACPMFANFKEKTPTIVTLVKEYDQVKVA
ncbi:MULTISPECIES: OsmC family protein [Myroides]|uniref:Osmotically inducible protein OsmC n=1 Tax=Myroides odoratimimus TaxID=76832 RepID=A0AAI8C3E6_9FLAO|nr:MULTISPECIES: OsmC family protein [Myroides]ALU25316.1 osmotically inducible protein OsmC [Myroides odoratimimus]APA91321.1 osmotically inducible protein OsmC [Myroides sp. ZB35]MCS7472061.1 OsmC family protein [Myroides odoratimimus]MDM1034014.1 OsmC family protein [Myroides odoratimimus]MDM1037969.1 OsmC family protein [Myroides odoratimimus]